MFVAAFANSNKAIKDGYDSQIKDYDHELNGCRKTHGAGEFELGREAERQLKREMEWESQKSELRLYIANIDLS